MTEAERNAEVIAAWVGTEFPTAAQYKRIHDKVKELGYDKLRIEVDTRGNVPQIRYSFHRGRSMVSRDEYGLYSRKTIETFREWGMNV